MEKTKDKLNVEIDMKEIKEKIEKYIYKKIQFEIKDAVSEIATEIGWQIDSINLKNEDVNEKLEKIIDWIKEHDTEKGEKRLFL